MSDEREQTSSDTDIRSFDTTVDGSTEPVSVPAEPTAPAPEPNTDVAVSPVAESPTVTSPFEPTPEPSPEDSSDVPSEPAGELPTTTPVETDPPLWVDTVDANAPVTETTPEPTAPDPVPVNTVPAETPVPAPVDAAPVPVPVTTVPDSPVPVPETPPVAAVELPENVSGKLYELDTNGIPDPTQEFFSEDVSEFLLEYLAQQDEQGFILAKIRFILRKNYERDDDNK